MLGRSQMNVAPILGVLMVVFVGFSWMLRYVEVWVPTPNEHARQQDPNIQPAVRIELHADRSIELAKVIYGPWGAIQVVEQRHIEPPNVETAVAGTMPNGDPDPMVVYVQADDGVRWGDFVETVSSVSHITGGEVAIATDDE